MTVHPNPIREETKISFDLDKPARTVTISIRNEAGELVREMIISGAEAGQNTVPWDGRDESGVMVPNGVYYCEVNFGNASSVGTATSVQNIVVVR